MGTRNVGKQVLSKVRKQLSLTKNQQGNLDFHRKTFLITVDGQAIPESLELDVTPVCDRYFPRKNRLQLSHGVA
jgi:hypothetical protein